MCVCVCVYVCVCMCVCARVCDIDAGSRRFTLQLDHADVHGEHRCVCESRPFSSTESNGFLENDAQRFLLWNRHP